MSFDAAVAASRRLAILRLLAESEGSANESVIRTGLGMLGFRGRTATEADVRADLNLLRDAGLVDHEWFGGRVLVAAITKRGAGYLRREVAPIEGVEQPSLGR